MIHNTNKKSSANLGHAMSRIFSKAVLKELSHGGSSPSLRKVILESGLATQNGLLEKSLGEFYDSMYLSTLKRNKDEYCIKNLIVNKILLGKHSINTARLFYEVRVGNSKADAVLFNGTSHIYEIKSDLDSFNRLEGQLSDYLKLSEFTSVVTTQKHLKKAQEVIPDRVGLYVVNTRGGLSCVVEPESNLDCLSHSAIYEFLHEKERVELLQKYYAGLPSVRRLDRFSVYLGLFRKIPVSVCHSFMVSCGKSRSMPDFQRSLLLSAPISLKSAALSLSLGKKGSWELLESLKKPIGVFI